jgi:hypothetical protein
VDSFYIADMFWHEPTSSIVVVKVANTGREQDSGLGILNPHDDRMRQLDAALGNATRGGTSYRTMAFDPAGYLLLGGSNGNLWALRVDSETLDPEGRPQFVRSGTRIDDVGANGLFLGETMRGTPGYELVAFNPDTHGIRQIASLEAPALFPSISDDGQFLAGTSVDTYVINLERGDVRRVYDRVAAVSTWLPDHLGFTAANYRSAGGSDIYRLDPDGVSEPDTLIAGPESEFYAALSPDRTKLMYYVAMPETGRDLWIADVTIDENGISVEGSPREWYAGSNEDVMPAWHPDGNWVLYAANQTGQYEVYVRAYPSAGNERRVSLRGGYDPAWSPNGDAIYYRDADSLYTVRVLDASSMQFSDPVGILDVSSSRVLFNTQLERSYAVNPVSGELLMNRIQASTADFRRLIIVNWRAMLSE